MASRNRAGGSDKPDGASSNGDGVAQGGIPLADGAGSRKSAKIATVSHTLDAEIADRLRHFAFRERMSESAVIEFALRELFGSGDDATLGVRLREAGAALRRKL